jgi:hypothetical protein
LSADLRANSHGNFPQPDDVETPLWQQSVHLRTRVDALRESGLVLGATVGRAAATSAAFSLRNWTLEQNLEYLAPIIETLARNRGFKALVDSVAREVAPRVKQLNDRDKGCYEPEFYENLLIQPQQREPRETPLAPLPTPRDRNAWSTLGVFFFDRRDLTAFFADKAGVENSVRDTKLQELDVTRPEFWQQKPPIGVLELLVGRLRFGVFELLENTVRVVVWRPVRGCPAYLVAVGLDPKANRTTQERAWALVLGLVTSLRLGPRLLDYMPPLAKDVHGLAKELAFRKLLNLHPGVQNGAASVLPKTKPDEPCIFVLVLTDPDEPDWATLVTGADKLQRVEGGVVVDIVLNDPSDPRLVFDVIFTVRALCPYAALSLYFDKPATKVVAQDWCQHPVARPALQLVGAENREQHLQLLQAWASGRMPRLAAGAQV